MGVNLHSVGGCKFMHVLEIFVQIQTWQGNLMLHRDQMRIIVPRQLVVESVWCLDHLNRTQGSDFL
jgi:hypothetical protein